MSYKRKSIVSILIILIYTCLSMFCFAGCKQLVPPIKNIQVHSNFSVNFLDVGQGDCIFIRLPDGKNMLIDCGEDDKYNENSK